MIGIGLQRRATFKAHRQTKIPSIGRVNRIHANLHVQHTRDGATCCLKRGCSGKRLRQSFVSGGAIHPPHDDVHNLAAHAEGPVVNTTRLCVGNKDQPQRCCT